MVEADSRLLAVSGLVVLGPQLFQAPLSISYWGAALAAAATCSPMFVTQSAAGGDVWSG